MPWIIFVCLPQLLVHASLRGFTSSPGGNHSADNDIKIMATRGSWNETDEQNSNGMDDPVGINDGYIPPLSYRTGPKVNDLGADDPVGINDGYIPPLSYRTGPKVNDSGADDPVGINDGYIPPLSYRTGPKVNDSGVHDDSMSRRLTEGDTAEQHYDPAGVDPPTNDELVGKQVGVISLATHDWQLNEVKKRINFLKTVRSFHGEDALQDMARFLNEILQTDVTRTASVILGCARDRACPDAWTTDPRLWGKNVIIKRVLSSWSMTSGGNRCHVKSELRDMWCHRPEDLMSSEGRAYMALAVPSTEPNHTPLPLSYVCHTGMGAKLICHTMPGNDFLLPPAEVAASLSL